MNEKSGTPDNVAAEIDQIAAQVAANLSNLKTHTPSKHLDIQIQDHELRQAVAHLHHDGKAYSVVDLSIGRYRCLICNNEMETKGCGVCQSCTEMAKPVAAPNLSSTAVTGICAAACIKHLDQFEQFDKNAALTGDRLLVALFIFRATLARLPDKERGLAQYLNRQMTSLSSMLLEFSPTAKAEKLARDAEFAAEKPE